MKQWIMIAVLGLMVVQSCRAAEGQANRDSLPDDRAFASYAAPVLPADPDNARGEAPRDMQPTWFPHPPLVDFENLDGWTCAVYPPATGQFSRSQAMPLAGQYTGRLRFTCPSSNAWAVLKPPQPLLITQVFNHVQMWAYSPRRGLAVSPVLVLRDAAGQTHRLALGTVFWPYWSILDIPVHEPLALPASLVAIEFSGLRTESEQAESIYFDNLAFYTASTTPLEMSLPPAGSTLAPRLPTRDKSIVPTPAEETTGEAIRTGEIWVFRIRSGGQPISYRFEPQTGTLADLTVRVGGQNFTPCSGGGVRVILGGKEYAPGDPALKVEYLGPGSTLSAPEFRFRLSVGDQATEVIYRLTLIDASLVIEASCASASGLQAGRPPVSARYRQLFVPYLSYGYEGSPVLAGPDGWFGSWLWDYYNTDASRLSNTDTQYLPLTNGTRNPLRDRLVLTFARRFENILPNIPNPRATQAPNAIENVYCAVATGSAQALNVLNLWQQFKRYGVDHLIAKQHAEIWSPGSSAGTVPFFQNPHASPGIPGGDQALTEYIAKVKALGYRYALYTDYVLTMPVEAQWNEDDVSRGSDDSWLRDWYQAFQLTPLQSWVRAATYAPQIAQFGNNASYCDQHTSGPPWHWTDYDARKPLAGMFRPVIDAYAAVFEAERRAYKGPVYSEGNYHWMMAGLCDGNYARFSCDDRPPYQSPLLVDFDLLKIHPLEMDLGMGWQAAYGLANEFDSTGAANDRLLMATLIFGHAGLIYAPWNAPGRTMDPADPLGECRWVTLRTYFMTQQAQKRYLLQPVTRIEYESAGAWLATGEALANGAVNDGRVRVTYRNGLQVWANGSFTTDWEITLGAQQVVLPPGGYAVYQPGQLLEHSSLVNGKRADLAVTPEYVYADARGHQAPLGPLRLDGAAVLKPEGKALRVITLNPAQTIAIKLAQLPFTAPRAGRLRVVWEDEAGTRREEAPAAAVDGELTLRFPDWALLAVVRTD